jgi:hypothetical protein
LNNDGAYYQLEYPMLSMRAVQLSLVLTGLMAPLVSVVGSSSAALADDINTLPFERFYCGIKSVETDDGETINVPATVGTFDGTETVIYYWLRAYYIETAESPLVICDRVSSTLDLINRQGTLGFIAQGTTSEGEPAICANTSCSRPIFTLLPEEDPEQVLEDLQIALTTEPGNNGPVSSSRNYNPFGDMLEDMPDRNRPGGRVNGGAVR